MAKLSVDGLIRIGQLAAELGLNPKTIRYYEQIGVLPAPRRTDAGYRLYSEADIERLRFVAKAKAIGLTLDEISEIFELCGDGERPCGHVRSLLDQKIMAVDRQLRALEAFRRELVARRDAAAQATGSDAHVCWIIEQPASPDLPPAPIPISLD